MSQGETEAAFTFAVRACLTVLIWHGGSGASAISAVTNFTAATTTNSSVLLTWVASNNTNASRYTYDIEVLNSTAIVKNITNLKGNNVTVKDLDPGANYSFNIYTNDSGILSNAESISTTTHPSPVSNLAVIGSTGTSLTLSWDTPNDLNKATYTYEITTSNGSDTWTNPTKQNVKTEVIKGLSPGVNYNFTVYTQTVNSVRSIEFASINRTTNPSPVSNLTVIGSTTTSLTLSWNIPNDINKASYTYVITTSNGSDTWTNPTKQNVKTEEIKNLSPGVNYNFTVHTQTADSVRSIEFASINKTTNPSPVSNLAVNGSTTTSLTLSWNIPNDINKANYTYAIITSNGNDTWTNTTKQNAKSEEIKNLSPGVNYNFTVYTQTADSVRSIAFASINGTTNPSPVSNLIVNGSTTTSLTLSWNIPNDLNKASYTYEITTSNGSDTWTNPTKQNVKSEEIKGLSPGVNYNFTVYTRTADSVRSTAFASINGTTNPSPASDLKISKTNTTSLTLSWIVPNDINKATYSYVIHASNSSSSPWTITTEPNVASKDIPNLLPGVNYNFTVYTQTANSVRSIASVSINGTTNPSPVSELKITDSTTTSLTLSWKPPSDTNHGTYSYVISTSNSNKTWNTTDNNKQITDLFPGVNYNFTVYTQTADFVLSIESASINGTTNPSRVSNLTITKSTTNNLTLSWNIPNDTNKASYTYVINTLNGSSSRSNDSWNITTTQNAGSKDIINLLPGVNYTFTVYTRTINSVESNASDSIIGTTNPSSVSNLIITGRTTTSLDLSWTVPNDINEATYTYVIMTSNSGTPRNTTTQNASSKIQELSPGVNYTFDVYTRTVNSVENLGKVSVIGTTIPSPVTSVTLVNRNTSSITISWETPKDVRVKEYNYNVFVSNGKPIKTTDSKYTATGLEPGMKYTFHVASLIDNLNSANSTYTASSDPNFPINLTGSPTSNSSISVVWLAPSDPNAKSYNYSVTWIDQNEPSASSEKNTVDTSIQIESLKAGHLYNVTIRSLIDNAKSEANQIWVQTNPNTIERPQINNITNSSVIFTWSWPTPPVSGMEIRSTTGGNYTIKTITDTLITQYKMENLISGNFYEFSLRSFKSSDPAKAASARMHRRAATSEKTTYSVPVVKSVQIEPAAVLRLWCSKVGGGYEIKVGFDCPSGNFSQINVLVDGGKSDPLINCTGNDAVNVKSLSPAQGYNVQVETQASDKTVKSQSIKCRTDDVGVIVGAIFGVLLFLLLVGLIVFFILKKRRSKKPEIEISDVKNQRRFHTISKERFPDYFYKQHADSDFGFAEEYQELSSTGTKQSKREAELPENRAKNRFTNVLSYDHSRVKLDCIDGIQNSDYINANYMPGYSANKEFIASQGPLPNTSSDFWRMIWEHHVNTIVMLTNCMENGRVKCEHYWPLDYTPCTYGDITVTVSSETILPEWTIRDFSLKHARQQGVKQVRHFHFTVWPDHGVPENTTNIIQFRRLVREHMDQRKSNGPTVVHCSAGVGRTGTLIALDYLIQQMEKEHRISVYGIVEKMRMSRPLMVQTESQYVFLNKCVLSLIEQPDEENVYENQANDLIYENASAIRNYSAI